MAFRFGPILTIALLLPIATRAEAPPNPKPHLAANAPAHQSSHHGGKARIPAAGGKIAKAKPAKKPEPTPAPAPVAAPSPPENPAKGSVTGLTLPRFAALRADEVNLRAGPGRRYPIEWLYRRRGLPVEIDREFEVWRLVTTPDGGKGWVHEATLVGRRDFVVTGTDRTLRAAPSDTASAVAILQPGVVGRIRACDAGSDWCRMQVGRKTGWLKRDQFWGALPNEAVAPG